MCEFKCIHVCIHLAFVCAQHCYCCTKTSFDIKCVCLSSNVAPVANTHTNTHTARTACDVNDKESHTTTRHNSPPPNTHTYTHTNKHENANTTNTHKYTQKSCMCVDGSATTMKCDVANIPITVCTHICWVALVRVCHLLHLSAHTKPKPSTHSQT